MGSGPRAAPGESTAAAEPDNVPCAAPQESTTATEPDNGSSVALSETRTAAAARTFARSHGFARQAVSPAWFGSGWIRWPVGRVPAAGARARSPWAAREAGKSVATH